MHKDNYTDFDLELRSMLQNAEEEVPSQVWNALRADLDRRDRSKVVTLWWRRAAVGVAAAAALAGVFIALNHGGGITGTAPVQVVAEAPEQTPSEFNDNSFQTIEEQIMTSSAVRLADVPAPKTRSTQSTVPSAVEPVSAVMESEPESASEPETVTYQEQKEEVKTEPAKTEKSKEVSEDIAAILDRLEYEQVHGKSAERKGISLVLEGIASSNDKEADAITGPFRTEGSGKASTGISEKSISTFGVPLSFGVGARYSVNDRWSVGTGINYSLLTRSFSGIYTEVDGSGNVIKSVNSDITNELHYIGIPLNFYYNVLSSSNIRFYTWAGGQAEKGLVNRYKIFAKPEDIIYRKSVDGLQWSAAVGLGLEFSLTDKLGLYIDPSARYYFDCKQPNSVRTQRPYMMNIEAGLRFNL